MEVEMKMVKSLLLGTAAGLAAVAGAQAADMPVKAAPVQYVKICTLYGDGFYYIPGTDTCIKMGGYVRVQVETKAGGGGIPDGTLGQVVQARYTRGHTNDYDFRVRGAISWDVRQQTQYGTLRTYIRTGVNQTTPADGPGGSVFWDRAFIQFAGFTVGKAQSFYDTVTYGGAYSYHNVRTVSDTGASGWNVWAYTAQFGNGWSGTLSLEDPNRGKLVVDTSADNFFQFGGGSIVVDNAFATNNNLAALFASGTTLGYQSPSTFGFRTPDFVANLRWDQAWGYISASGAIHDASGTYWGTLPGAGSSAGNALPATRCTSAVTPECFGQGTILAGHPADAFGYAFSIGGLFNLQGGDKLGVNVQWSLGAAGYGAAPVNNWGIWNGGTSVGGGWAPDAVFDFGTDIEKTTVWNVIAFYEHIWSPQWKTSVFGGYVQVEFSDAAKNIILSRVSGADAACGVSPHPFGGQNTNHFLLLPGNSCDPDFSFFQVGTRTQWNPVAQLDIGLEFLYTRLNTAFAGPAIFGTRDERVGNGVITTPLDNTGTGGANPVTFTQTHDMSFEDQNVFSVLMRVQRNFFP
jgi:hypothetical protein